METRMTLNQKLMQIQRNVFGFINSEDSAKKKEGTDKNEYRYTPGWEITETVRRQMDDLGVMLNSSVTQQTHEVLEYPVYKLIDGKPVSLQKKEVLYNIEMEYWFVDTETGETTAPRKIWASGMNGMEKGMGSALSMAQRYIFLKQFNIATKDRQDEMDAIDHEHVPGLRNSDFTPCSQAEVFASVQRQQSAPAPASYDTGAAQQQVRITPAFNSAVQPMTAPKGSEDSVRVYNEALNSLRNFQRDTPTHQQVLNGFMIKLNMAGYNTSDPNFTYNLVEQAQALRENRQPMIRQ